MFVIVWNPKKVEWSIDGRVVATHITNIPQKKAHFAFNCWGTNSPNWGGTATVNHQRQMTVSSFQFTPLTTGLHLPADQWKLLNRVVFDGILSMEAGSENGNLGQDGNSGHNTNPNLSDCHVSAEPKEDNECSVNLRPC
jgi:beta-glucanase (GH16 family)